MYAPSCLIRFEMDDYEQIAQNSLRKILGDAEFSELYRNQNTSIANANELPIFSAIQQQLTQQMDRMRITNIMSQELHPMWPYNGAAIHSGPLMPPYNMSAMSPYSLTGPMPYAAMSLYPGSSGMQNPSQQQQQQLQNQSQQIQYIQLHQQQQCTVTALQCPPSPSHYDRFSSGCQILDGPAATSSPSSSVASSTSSPTHMPMGNHKKHSNRMNIRINPLNFDSLDTVQFDKEDLLSYYVAGGIEYERDDKDNPSSVRSSPMLLSPDSSDFASIINGPKSSNTSSGSAGDSITIAQAKFTELTRLALRGSEIAEKLAYTHRNRPCFKKIDSLCARMKQDLIRPDGVLPNINSQGIAWAVKDFIFVFTRVINAWIIIKGYVYNTPDGLSKVKAALSPEFASSFLAWQDMTLDFVENLIKSFVNLDSLVQSQKNVHQKPENNNNNNGASGPHGVPRPPPSPIKLLQPGVSLLDDSFDFLNDSSEKSQSRLLNKNYLYTMVEDSEGSQRQATANGTYFKTGTYNPIKKDSGPNVAYERNAAPPPPPPPPPPPTTSTPGGPIGMSSMLSNASNNNNSAPANPSAVISNFFDDPIGGAEYWTHGNVIESPSAESTASAMEGMKIKEKIPPNWINYDIRVLEQNLSEFSKDYDPTQPPKPMSKDLIYKLNVMIERLMGMKHAELFFKTQFTQNYFPDFTSQYHHEFIDVRSIILKCQVGGYRHIFEVVHDVRRIIRMGIKFLKVNTDVEFQKALTAFETEFNNLLRDAPFDIYNFDHIIGEPKEHLYINDF